VGRNKILSRKNGFAVEKGAKFGRSKILIFCFGFKKKMGKKLKNGKKTKKTGKNSCSCWLLQDFWQVVLSVITINCLIIIN
jgi:hypothetical protein